MKNLLFFFFFTLSISAFSQLSNSQSNWSNGFLNKRVLQTHYEKAKPIHSASWWEHTWRAFIAMAGSASTLKLMKTTTLVSR